MASPEPALREPISIGSRADENLRIIRMAMERSSVFTALPGRGAILMGLSAVVAAWFAASASSVEEWFGIWLAEALIGFSIALAAVAWKIRTVETPASLRPARNFAVGLAPPLFAGAVLTWALYQAGATDLIPGVWLLLYGCGIATAGTFSIRIVPAMGACFAAVGVVTLFAPELWHNALLAVGFGGLHMIFGGIVWRKYGG